MTWLLDGNVLVALVLDSHIYHNASRDWFVVEVNRFATCCMTQGTLLRVHMQMAEEGSASAA
jgi:predicted nucleic acid-binding protein